MIGGDGAGKTTCLRVLAGLIEPSAGVSRRPAKEEIGYVPATAGLYPDLTVDENIAFTASAYRMSRDLLDRRRGETLDRTGLTGVRHRLGGQLSGGMQRKLAVGLALLHSPELLILDEPTTGVDPVSRAELWRLIAGAAAGGTAVVVSTTYVNEAARATAVVLLEGGKVLLSGTPDDILSGVPGAVGVTSGGVTSVGVTSGERRPGPLAWRRGPGWRVWVPDGDLPAGVRAVQPDFQDAVVVAALADATGR